MPKLSIPTGYELFERPRPPRLSHKEINLAESALSESGRPAMAEADRECARLLINACFFDPPLTDDEINAYAQEFGISSPEAELELRELRNES